MAVSVISFTFFFYFFLVFALRSSVVSVGAPVPPVVEPSSLRESAALSLRNGIGIIVIVAALGSKLVDA